MKSVKIFNLKSIILFHFQWRPHNSSIFMAVGQLNQVNDIGSDKSMDIANKIETLEN